MELYQNIRKRRKELRMSQDELARKVGYTDRSSIAKIENGDVDLPQSKIILIARALDVDAGILMGNDGISTPSTLSSHEQEHIRKYRRLDEKGQHAVDVVTDMEYGRVMDEDRKKAAPASVS